MNLVIDDAVEVKQPTKSDPEVKRRELGNSNPALSACSSDLGPGQILLKGDNVSLIQAL